MHLTPLAKLIALSLRRDLREVVVEARNAGKNWRQIAADLTKDSGVKVSAETLRSWFTDELVVTIREERSA